MIFFIDFFPIYLVFTLISIIAFLILIASYYLGIQKPDTEKVSLYECGFDPYGDSREKFNIRFYLIAILFIVFDLETILLFPWAINLGQLCSFSFWIGLEFIIELLVGFFYIWKIGGLNWK